MTGKDILAEIENANDKTYSWIGELVYDSWSCGACGKRFPEWEERPTWKFCPECGMPMRGTAQ